ncbi:MAG: NAD(P)-dependent oxidoreductase [Turneriella sp.]|nr:NAD(P)-dependent oxidoreductase [Turneriella sp.]
MEKTKNPLRILLTGGSSFTGMHFAETLAARGHRVVAALSALNRKSYTGVRAERVHRLAKTCEVVTDAAFGSKKFLALLKKHRPHVLCHHAAEVQNYKSPDFDFLGATGKNCHNVRATLALAHECGVGALVLTSSVFEAGMGLGEEPLRAFSPYGLSKTLTREVFSYFAQVYDLPLRIFTIPNPFGPFEEPRFVHYLVECWAKGETPVVKTPRYLRDNIPVDLLALAYVACVEYGGNEPKRFSPQGYVSTQGEFAQRVAHEFSRRIGIAYQVEIAEQKDFSEPLMRTNRDSARQQFPQWDEVQFWDNYAAYYKPRLLHK